MSVTGEGRSRGVAPEGADSDEIAAYIESNRSELDRNLSRLEERLSPRGMLDMVVDRMREGAGVEYVKGLRDSVVRNPLPVALTAVGVAWTALSDRYPAGHHPSQAHAGEGGRMHRTGERLSTGARHAGGQARELMGKGQERLHSIQERAGAWRGAAAARSRESARRAEEFSREHPLVLAGAGLTLGAILAALVPTTRAEEEYLGPTRDRLVEGAGEAVSSAAERARDTMEQRGQEQGQDREGGPSDDG